MNPWNTFDITLDHLVVAASSLESGAAWLEQKLGVPLQGGGQHPGWGTHNRLLQLGGGTYLELIAPDPGQPEPQTPRPFALDDARIRSLLAERPRLIHFVMRSPQLAQACDAVGYQPGRITPMSRGTLNWRITLPDNGAPAAQGLLPTLIQWDIDFATQHPSSVLEDRGVSLRELQIGAPAEVLALLRGVERDPRINLLERDPGSLAATFSTPNGEVRID